MRKKVTHTQAVEALKKVSDYCSERNSCSECVFSDTCRNKVIVDEEYKFLKEKAEMLEQEEKA